MLFAAVAIVGGDAAGIPQGGCGLVNHGVLGFGKDIVPQELTFSHGVVKLGDQVLFGSGGEGGDKA